MFQQRRMPPWGFIMFVVLCWEISAAPARAQVTPGVRGGVTLGDLDQVYFGGHVETTPLVDRLHFRPNLEIGFGDDVKLFSFNFEFVYKFPSQQSWQLYAGGGPAVNFFDGDSHSETGGGFNMMVGAENRRRVFFEVKIGVVDSPDVRFGVGYTFR